MSFCAALCEMDSFLSESLDIKRRGIIRPPAPPSVSRNGSRDLWRAPQGSGKSAVHHHGSLQRLRPDAGVPAELPPEAQIRPAAGGPERRSAQRGQGRHRDPVRRTEQTGRPLRAGGSGEDGRRGENTPGGQRDVRVGCGPLTSDQQRSLSGRRVPLRSDVHGPRGGRPVPVAQRERRSQSDGRRSAGVSSSPRPAADGGQHQLSVRAEALPVVGPVLHRQSRPGHDVSGAGRGGAGRPSVELRSGSSEHRHAASGAPFLRRRDAAPLLLLHVVRGSAAVLRGVRSQTHEAPAGRRLPVRRSSGLLRALGAIQTHGWCTASLHQRSHTYTNVLKSRRSCHEK